MKGPTINDLSHSASPNVVGHLPSQRIDQNHTGGLSPQRLQNFNQNNRFVNTTLSVSPFQFSFKSCYIFSGSPRNFGSRLPGYVNVQPVEEQLPAEDPFAEYAWMMEEDEFDRQVSKQVGLF